MAATALVVTLAVVQLAEPRYSAADDFLVPHNDACALVGVPALSWDDTLAAYARNHSDRLASGGCAVRRSGGPYGEHLFWSTDASFTAADAVALWVAERQSYDYNTNSCSLDCRHYMQVVWRATTSLGCATAACRGAGAGVIMVCEYFPPGDVAGRRPY